MKVSSLTPSLVDRRKTRLAHTLVYSVGKSSISQAHSTISYSHFHTHSLSLSLTRGRRAEFWHSCQENSGEPTSQSRSIFTEIPSRQLLQVEVVSAPDPRAWRARNRLAVRSGFNWIGLSSIKPHIVDVCRDSHLLVNTDLCYTLYPSYLSSYYSSPGIATHKQAHQNCSYFRPCLLSTRHLHPLYGKQALEYISTSGSRTSFNIYH